MLSPKPRTYKALTLAEKIVVIKEVERGAKKKHEIAKEFGIPANTLSTYLKNKEKILGCESKIGKGRKRLRGPSKNSGGLKVKIKNERKSTEVQDRASENFAGQLDQSIPAPSTDGESMAGLSYTHSYGDTDTQGVDQLGTSEGGDGDGDADEDEGWDAVADRDRERVVEGERPGGVFEDTLDLFGRYLASILRQLPDAPCYTLQQKFIDEAISARLSVEPRLPAHKRPQPPEDGNKQPLSSDSSRRKCSQGKKTQKNKTRKTPSSAEVPVQPAPPVLAEKIKEEVIDYETSDETNDALNDEGDGIDIDEQELSLVKQEIDTDFELVMCDGLNQGSTGPRQRESTVSATSTEKASPLRCLMCPKTFVRSSGLRNHCRDKHADCDSNSKSKFLNQNEQQSKRPCLEVDRQMPTGILEHCLMDPGGNTVLASPTSAPTTSASTQKRLLLLVSNKPTVSSASPVVPSIKPLITSISSGISGHSIVPCTNSSQVPINNKPGPSVQSQQSGSTQSVLDQPFSLDPNSMPDK